MMLSTLFSTMHKKKINVWILSLSFFEDVCFFFKVQEESLALQVALLIKIAKIEEASVKGWLPNSEH